MVFALSGVGPTDSSSVPPCTVVIPNAGQAQCYLLIIILVNPKLSLYYCCLREKQKSKSMAEKGKQRNKQIKPGITMLGLLKVGDKYL